ncbi:MAG TPA: M10 family metallopeptidase C-terminal domain-containing protein [Allosphingosinicella sp.]|jgi:Ca2+-binding RTX toxin-like protein|uniref:M10 family metallopeptidase C-terminal domain-containing protein n=1 Tax=Allosphingosinicella sp. TaxID=2823234 RepID=UPI002F27EB7F
MSTSELGYDASTGDLASDPLEVTHVTVVEGCGCAICQSLNDAGTDGAATKGGVNNANPESGNIGSLLTLGTNPDGSRFFSGNRNVDATLIGSKWGTQDLTFSFPTSGTNYNGAGYDSNGVSLYHLDLGTQQQIAARAGFAQISAYTNLNFTEIVETDTVHANIRISQSADNDVPSAYGGFPSDTRGVAGDIWFGRTNQPYYDLQHQGTWGFSTMLHEIGHTMGLKHGHQDYTNSDLSFFFGTSPRFGSQSLTADRDGQAWSLMTYTPAPFTNSGFAGEKSNQPQTFMQYDIAALQYMYGADYTTNAGDSVYTFSQTTGEMFINNVGQGAPSGNKILLTIWDGGGNDTIDGSNYAGGVTIDLRPGEFSTVDQAQLANHLAAQNLTALAPGNIAMSLLHNNDARSLIENAKGGVGNDIFVGNTANNVLDGGAGSDTVIFTNPTGVNVTLNDTGADVIVEHDGEKDTLRSIENIGGTSGNDSITGNSQDNVLTGGSGGADTLSGGGGNDSLLGGGFTTTTTFSAPSQADIIKPQAVNNGSIATAVATAGAYDVDANPNIADSTSIAHATINATATGGSLEYYRIDVAAGAVVTFDIDTNVAQTNLDSWIELVNASGTVLANNDTGASGDFGGTGNDDARLTYTFATAGTYYIRVGQWTTANPPAALPLTAGQTYTLHISDSSVPVTKTVTANNTSSLIADGGEGNDLLQGTLANDTLTGGIGSDTASFVNAFSGGSTTGVTVDLNTQGMAQNTVAAGSDTLTGIENLIGSALNDTLTGNAGDNVIEGGLGDDALIGGAGNDTASYAGSKTGVTASLALQGAAQNTVNAGIDTLNGFENLLGSSFNDSLTGDAAANTLSGGVGDDTLNPGANAAGAVDLLDGGTGSDTASFAGPTGVTATLNGATDGTVSIGGAAVATLRNIENLLGGANADTLTGDTNANVIDGGLGNDVLDGGAGVDTVSFASRGTAGITVNLATLTAQDTLAGSKTIMGFENVRGTAGGDNITGDGGDNVFFEGGGSDLYNGAAGSDTVDYSAATSIVSVNLTTTVAQNTGTFGGSDTITNVENVVGAAGFANTLTGNAGVNRMTGGSAADTISGGAGNDVIVGGAGNDTLVGDVIGGFSSSDGADVIDGGAGSDLIVGGAGNDTLRGGDGDDTLVGGLLSSQNTVFTNDGGQDTFDGGEGTDIAYAYYTDQTGGIAFDLANLAGNSAITMGGAAAGSFTSVERVIFRGGSGGDIVKGGGTLDTLVGNAGDDVLDGWLGNDTLSGGLGNDTLNGGEGLDTATYVNSTAGVNVDLRIQGVGMSQNTGGEGIDTLIGIEYLTGSTFGDTLRGNDDFNLIIDNTVASTVALAQTDSIFGYGGNDSILVTRAATAVATNITMDGGEGDDLIQLTSGTVTFNTNANGTSADPMGLSSGATYVAPGRSGTRFLDVVSVSGGSGNDRIVLTGVDSALVDLGTGNDVLSISTLGGVGFNDHDITTGTGQDVIQLAGSGAPATTTERANIVRDFTVGDAGDRFELRSVSGSNFAATSWVNTTNFTGLTSTTQDMFDSGYLRLVQSGTDMLLQADRDGTGAASSFVTIAKLSGTYTGGFTSFNFDGMVGSLNLQGQGSLDETLTGSSKADTLSGNGGNDTLIGLAGNDTLDGGSGNDVLRGGTGDDTLIGGADADTASYSDATAGVTVDLSILVAQATGAGSDTLSGIENLTGSGFDDTLKGDAGANVIDGAAGNDTLEGKGGKDTIDGGAGADTLLGGADDDTLDGGEGDDLLIGGEGADKKNGGSGRDVASYRFATAAVAASLLTLKGTAGEAAGDTFTGIEDLEGGSAGDTLEGDALANTLTGLAGSDRLTGGSGDDRLNGGEGADVLDGGAGFDIASFRDAKEGVTVTIANSGRITVSGEGAGDTFISIEALEGSGFTDTMTGGSNNDTLFGGAGDDSLVGGNGNDKLDGGVGNDKLDGGAGNDQLFGRAGGDTILAGTGNDIIDGGAGADVLTGGTGNDMFIFQSAEDIGMKAGERDRITDFVVGFDKIDFSRFYSSAEAQTGFSVVTDLKDLRAYDVAVYNDGTTTFVTGDWTGDGIADFTLELTGKLALKRSDFVLNEADWNAGLSRMGVQADYSALHSDVMI